ncbi:MAG: amidohydrolase family protein [Bryobacteraceae bacterium]|jgi:predicted TIM-barrel fold metal-dependent hydrolase
MDTPWGPLPVADAHVHFFSNRFFASLAAQKGISLDELSSLLGWQIPATDPVALADYWINELDRYGVQRAAIIASVPGDEDSVIAASGRHPDRFLAYAMVNPCAEDACERIARALDSGCLKGLCFFPAMHRYSIQDDRAVALIELLAARRGVAFVHCGVLTVGVRRKLDLPSEFDLRFSNPVDLHAVALRYPNVRFVIPHFGAGYFREALMVADLCPNVYMDTSSSNMWMRYEQDPMDLRAVFRRALAVVGPSRLLFGTDSSFFPRGWHRQIFETQTRVLYELGVSADDARMVLHDNLAGLFS